MMTTIMNPTEAPELEAVVNVDEAAAVAIDALQAQVEMEKNAEEGDVPPSEAEPIEAAVECDSTLPDVAVEGRTKGELVVMLAELLATECPVQEIRNEVDAIKSTFYRLRRAEVDALYRKAEAEGVEAEIAEDADELRLKELLKIYRERRDEQLAISDKTKEENLQAKLAIIEELKGLIQSEETLNVTFARFRELQQRWRDIGAVPQPSVKDLWERYNLHVENFYDFVKINKELRDLDWRRNFEHKSQLCEQAEALAAEPSAVDAFHRLQKLHDEWRETGPVAREFKEQLWERFKAASTVINRRYQEHFDTIKGEQIQNLEHKTALCEAVEALAAAEYASHKLWNKANERLLAIQAEWRTIGFAPKRDNAKIYERFRQACDNFFEKKRSFYADVKGEMDANLQLKEQLCEKAEALAESDDWKAATDQLLALQAEWKKVGSVSRRYADAVWKRFRRACDKFFERKSQYFAEVENQYVANLERKRALIEEMSQVDVKGITHDAIKEFQRRWSEIGYVPIKAKDELQTLYKGAIDRLFNALRGAGREQAMDRFKERVSSLRTSGEHRLRNERERLYNRVRQLEQEIATLENNIGFFSKGASSFIAEVEEKIARAKREMADTVEKVKMIDGE